MTDPYETPHHRADECPHAGVGKACRPCRNHFDYVPITPDERAAMRRLALTTPQTPGERAYVEHVPRLLDALETAEYEREAESVAAHLNLGRAERAEEGIEALRRQLKAARKGPKASAASPDRPAPEGGPT